MTSTQAVQSTVPLPTQPLAFLSAAHARIPLETRATAGQAAADLVRRLGLKNARLGPDCFCDFLRRRDPCGRYDCDLRDLSRKFLDHSIALRSQTGDRFLMGSNYTDDDGKNWHLGQGAREPVGEDADRLRHVGISWEILPISVYYPGHTTSIVFRREKHPRGRYAPSHTEVRKRLAAMLHEGLATGLDAQERAKEIVSLARRKWDEAIATGDVDLANRASTAYFECTKAQLQAGLATTQMMGIAMDFIAEARASVSESERRGTVGPAS